MFQKSSKSALKAKKGGFTMEQFSFYVIFESSIIKDKDLTNTVKLLYSYISGLSLRTGKCFASNTYLAKLLNTSPRHVCRCLDILKNKKYILIEYNKNSRIITPTINKFVELREKKSAEIDKALIENVDFDWLTDENN